MHSTSFDGWNERIRIKWPLHYFSQNKQRKSFNIISVRNRELQSLFFWISPNTLLLRVFTAQEFVKGSDGIFLFQNKLCRLFLFGHFWVANTKYIQNNSLENFEIGSAIQNLCPFGLYIKQQSTYVLFHEHIFLHLKEPNNKWTSKIVSSKYICLSSVAKKTYHSFENSYRFQTKYKY